jgi:hypothetical protein
MTIKIDDLALLLLEKGLTTMEATAVVMALEWANEHPHAFGQAKGTLWPEKLPEGIDFTATP